MLHYIINREYQLKFTGGFYMKKLVYLIIFSMLLSTTSCGTPESDTTLDPKSPVNVTLWHYYASEHKIVFENLIKEFNSTVGVEKGVIITPVAKSSIKELESELTDASNDVVTAAEMPDIFTAYEDKLIELDALGKVCDLKTYFSEEDIDKYVDDFININDEGKLLSIPVVKSTEIMYLEKNQLDEFALETNYDYTNLSTWEDYYELSRQYYIWTDNKTPDIMWDGKGFMGFDSIPNYIIIGNKQMGVDIIDGANENVVLNKEALKRIFDIYYTGKSIGYFDAVGAFRSDDVKANELVGYAGSTSGVSFFPTSIVAGDQILPSELLIKNYPVFDGGESYAIQQGANMAISTSTPEKQEGAALFLKWFTEPEQNLTFSMSSGYLPVEEDAFGESFNSRLDEMANGDQQQQNVANAYEYSSDQILNKKTYATDVFEGSYSVRNILSDTLIALTDEGKELSNTLKSTVTTEDELINQLDLDGQFEAWLSLIESELTKANISYVIN